MYNIENKCFCKQRDHKSNARSRSDAVTAAMALMPEGSVDEGHADEFQKPCAPGEDRLPTVCNA